MEDKNIIKSITKHKCPNCDCDIYIENHIIPPDVGSVFTQEEMEKAKEDCLGRIDTISIDEEKKKAVIAWLKDPSTVFGPDEVESIIMSLLTPNNE